MNCKYHKDVNATNTCNVCGEWICENCVLEVDGRIYCKDCLKQKIKSTTPTESYKPHTSKTHTHTSGRVYKSSFLTLICSVLPGCAQMYLGYTKRGLSLLIIFLLGLYIEFFSPLILITYVFGLFDAFKLKGNLERGIYQEDNISDIKNFVKENKLFMFILGFIIVVPMIIEFFDDIFDNMFHMGRHLFRSVVYFDLEEIFKICILGALAIIISTLIIKYSKKSNNSKSIEKIDIEKKDDDNKVQ